MTYASKGESVFRLPERLFPDCSPPRAKRSDARLKRFSSILDDRAWSIEENERYRYLYNLMSGSQTCVTRFSCLKYVPLEDLVRLLLAERNAYIKELERRLGITKDDEPGTSGVTPARPPAVVAPVKPPAPAVVTTGVTQPAPARPTIPKQQQQPPPPPPPSSVETPVNEIFKAGTFIDDEEQDSMKNKIAALTAELEECKCTRDTLREAMHKLENIDEIVNENESLKARLRCSDEMIKYLEDKKSKLEKELENLRTKSQIQMDLQEAQEMLLEVGEREKRMRSGDFGQLARERDHLLRRVEELQDELREARARQSEMELLRKQSESASVSLEEITRENECYRKKLASMKDLEKQIEELKRQANQIANKYKRDSIKACDQDKQMKDLCRELNQLREERDRLRRRADELACYEQQYNKLQSKLKQVDSILAENAMLNSKLASLDKLEMENQLLKCKLEQCQASEMEAAESREKIAELENAVADQEEEMKDLLCQIERLTRAYGDSSEMDRLREELCKKDCKLRLCEEQLAEIPLLEAEIDELRSKLENCYNSMTGSPMDGGLVLRDQDVATIIDGKYEERVAFEGTTDIYSDVRTERAPVLEKTDSKKMMTCEEVQELLQSSKGVITCVLEDMIEHQKEMEELERCNREMKDEIGMLKARLGGTEMDEFFREMADLKRSVGEKERRICCLEGQIARSGNLGKVNDHIAELEREIECLKDLNRKMRADLQEACCEVRRCAELESLLEEEKRARCAAEAAARQGESRTKSQKEVYNIEAKESDVDALRNRIECLNKLVEELRCENEVLKRGEAPSQDHEKDKEEKAALENLLNLLQCELDACRNEKDTDEEKALRWELNRLKDQNCQLRSLVNCYKERLELERCSKEIAGGSRAGSAGAEEENKKLKSDLANMQNELIDLCNRLDDCERRHREKSAEFDQLLGCYEGLAKKNGDTEKQLKEKEKELQGAKGQVEKLRQKSEELASANDVLKNRVRETKEPKVGADYEKELKDKHAIESTIRNVEEEVDGLTVKLEERGKAEQERNNLLKKQADMEAELEKLRKQLTECKQAEAGGKVTEREEKLLEEMVGMREQTEQTKAENKKLKEDLDKLKELLEQCKKSKANEEAQASLMSSKREGISYPVQPAPQAVPQAMIPIKEEQRASMLEQGKHEKMQAPEKASVIEAAPMETKVVVDKAPKETNDVDKSTKDDVGKAQDTKDGADKALETKDVVGKAQKTKDDVDKAQKTKDDVDKAQKTKDNVDKAQETKDGVGKAPKEIKDGVDKAQKTKDGVEKAAKAGATAEKGERAPGSGRVSDESIVSVSDVDPGYAKFVYGLNPFDHRQNVFEIERRYKDKMSELKQNNDEKVKRLVEQHTKESSMKDKAFKENVSSMRAGYESDIRKLVDRHKGSILRLQNLHEDEVNELNANYERQLEAMQTQNESVVNDLTSGAASKFKALAEQHNRDLKHLEEKYQKLLEEKEDEHAKSVAGGNDAYSTYEREMKRVKKSNLKRVEIVQQKYEKLLACERKKYERQLEETIKKMKQRKGVSDGICQCRFPDGGAKDPDAPLEFNEVLQKILANGLESLSFNEVALVHRRTCAATGDIVLNPEMKALLLPAITEDDAVRDSLSKANKEELLNRILVLENEIAMKQMETQDAIMNMELAVKAERQRLQQLRDSLRQEQEKNTDLKTKLSQSVMVSTPPTPKRTPVGYALPKPGDELPCMPPVRIEDIIPGSHSMTKSTKSLSGRALVIMDKIKELQKEKCVCLPVAAEKDTTKAKHEKDRGKLSCKDLKTKNKAATKKKGKK